MVKSCQSLLTSLVAGTYFNMHTDDVVDLDERFLGDLMEEKGVSWYWLFDFSIETCRKAYQEDYPGDCFQGYSSGGYVRKHNPFISFTSIHNNPERCAKIVSSAQLDIDLDAGTLPQYSYYTPTMDNDGHEYVLVCW